MGSGKTSWSIQHINREKFDNFLYITPFLDEVERIIENTDREFKQPINKGNGKLGAINEMLACQDDIASTHELFKHLDEESRENIKKGHYTLILDEVLNVVEPYDNIRNDDMKLLKDSGCVTVDEDGFVVWNKEKLNYDTKYNDIKILADNRSLIYINQKLLLWRYPPEIFELFDKVYILTYLFEASILKNYFNLYKIDFEQKSISEISAGMGFSSYTRTDLRSNRLCRMGLRSVMGTPPVLCLFIVDGQGGQAVQFQPGGVPGNVLVVALCGNHGTVVSAELQLRQVDLCTQLLGTVIYQLAQTSVGGYATGKANLLCPGIGSSQQQLFGQNACNALLKAGSKVGHVHFLALHLRLVHLVEHGGL